MKKHGQLFSIFFLLPSMLNAAPHTASGIILTYDLNEDQSLPLEEFVEARRLRFNNTDTNHDGVVDENEYVYEWEGRITKRFADDRKASVKQTHTRFNAIDKDKDGVITQDELNAVGTRGFDHMDHNHDGVVLFSDPEPVRRNEKLDKNARPVLRQRALLRMPTTHSIAGFVELYDTNGDNQVTRQEFQTVRDAHFSRSDENQDGRLTEQEYVLEFEDRLDQQIEKSYQAQVKQAYVRFDALDKNKDKAMTFSEYMQSGFRSFARHDTNEDGSISLDDPIRERRQPEADNTDAQTDTANEVAQAVTK